MGVGLRMNAQCAMRLFRESRNEKEKKAKPGAESRFHARLIKGLTGFATFAD
jgi:hypothetical protein